MPDLWARLIAILRAVGGEAFEWVVWIGDPADDGSAAARRRAWLVGIAREVHDRLEPWLFAAVVEGREVEEVVEVEEGTRA